MRFYLTFDNPELKLKVSELSRKLNIEIFKKPPQLQIKDFSEDYFFIYSKDRLFLKKGLRQNTKPIFSDFDDWTINYDDRLLKNSIKGLPKNFSCIDLTAGFGKDSLEISKSVNCKSLLLLEKVILLRVVITYFFFPCIATFFAFQYLGAHAKKNDNAERICNLFEKV